MVGMRKIRGARKANGADPVQPADSDGNLRYQRGRLAARRAPPDWATSAWTLEWTLGNERGGREGE